MRILFVFSEPLPMARARSFQAVRTALALAESGVDVVLMHDAGGTDPFLHYGLSRPRNLSAIQVSRSWPWPLSWGTSNTLFFRRAIRTMNGMRPFDAVFTRHLKFAAKFLDAGIRIPLIYEAHEVFSDTAPTGKRRARAAEERSVVKGGAAIVANSNATAARLEKLFGPCRRVVVIPNGVDRSDVYPQKNWTEARCRIIYAGSLFPWKGVDDLVAAGAWMAGCEIEIVGGSIDRIDELRRKVPQGGANFTFTGTLSHENVMKRLESRCIAILPNRDDPDSAFTSPIKLFEYMASGCAIVASDLPAIREILGTQDAQWAVPGSPESLASAIIAVASDESRAASMGRRLFDLSSNYTWAARGERLKSLLSSVSRG